MSTDNRQPAENVPGYVPVSTLRLFDALRDVIDTRAGIDIGDPYRAQLIKTDVRVTIGRIECPWAFGEVWEVGLLSRKSKDSPWTLETVGISLDTRDTASGDDLLRALLERLLSEQQNKEKCVSDESAKRAAAMVRVAEAIKEGPQAPEVK